MYGWANAADVELNYTHDGGARTPTDTFVDYRSELARAVGAKGYHAVSTGPYTVR